MPDCFSVPDAGARCSSARAATGASTTAGHVAAAPLGVNRCARRDAGISTLDAAGTVTPSASAATVTETLERFPTLTAARLFDMVTARGYTGGPDHFRHRIAQLRPRRPRKSDSVRQRLRDVALYGLAAQDHALLTEPWVERVIDIEDRERKRRSLERRLTNARIGAFKPIADFDWTWPKRIDRLLIEELFSLAFVDDATNIVLVGPNGVGKSMLIKNLLHHAVLNGFTARFTTASDMLHELAAQDSDASLARRLRRFTGPQLLAIDEVGYLNYDNRYADLLFEVVTRRYLTVPVLITTNKPFSEWAEVFSSAACVVTLVDRLIHRSE